MTTTKVTLHVDPPQDYRGPIPSELQLTPDLTRMVLALLREGINAGMIWYADPSTKRWTLPILSHADASIPRTEP